MKSLGRSTPLTVALTATLLVSPLLALADTSAQPKFPEFAWRAALQVPADAPLLRAELPPAALGALQSRSYNDIRVFDAQAQALPFALLPPPASSAQETTGPSVPALPLLQPRSAGGSSMVARVDVHSSGKGVVQHMQVQWDSAPASADGTGLQAAVFDLRKLTGRVSALDVTLQLPDNTPVHLQASLSKTLQQWQSLPTTGPLYQFQGANAPRNTRLQFTSPQAVQDHFLLLQWPANAGVQVQSVQPRTVSEAPAPAVVEVGLPQGEPAPGGKGLEWTLPPGAQTLSVQWSLPQPNQLRTLSLQGRRASTTGSSAPAWEPLGTVVVYHLVQNGEVRRNPPHALPPGDWHTLRLTDWPSGNTPPVDALQAKLQLQPVSLAFLANGQGPYTLAVGRADTPAAALPVATLSNAAATAPTSWPLATVGGSVSVPSMQAKRFTDRWRYFFEDSKARTGFLWLVLVGAVLALGSVALKLLRSAHSSTDANTPTPPPSA